MTSRLSDLERGVKWFSAGLGQKPSFRPAWYVELKLRIGFLDREQEARRLVSMEGIPCILAPPSESSTILYLFTSERACGTSRRLWMVR